MEQITAVVRGPESLQSKGIMLLALSSFQWDRHHDKNALFLSSYLKSVTFKASQLSLKPQLIMQRLLGNHHSGSQPITNPNPHPAVRFFILTSDIFISTKHFPFFLPSLPVPKPSAKRSITQIKASKYFSRIQTTEQNEQIF